MNATDLQQAQWLMLVTPVFRNLQQEIVRPAEATCEFPGQHRLQSPAPKQTEKLKNYQDCNDKQIEIITPQSLSREHWVLGPNTGLQLMPATSSHRLAEP